MNHHSLHLDERQRAMLLEMGVRLWSADTAAQQTATAPAPASVFTAPKIAARPPAAPPPAARAPGGFVSPPAHSADAAATRPAPPSGKGLFLHPPRVLYPHAASIPAGLGSCWLLVAEAVPAHAEYAEPAQRLLDNMLRALGLHHHPQVHLCTLDTPAQAMAQTTPAPQALAQVLHTLQPAVVLIMGRTAARSILGRSEPLGQLRGQVFTVGQVPAVVTFDVPELLRSNDRKPAAWQDLCRARQLAAFTAV